MIIYLLLLTAFIILLALAIKNIKMLNSKWAQQDNDTKLRHQTHALMYSILCIIIVIAFMLNIDEFFSDHIKYKNRMKEENQMQHSSLSIQYHGTLHSEEFFTEHPTT